MSDLKSKTTKTTKTEIIMNKENLPRFEIAALLIGELLVSLAVVGVFLIIGKFSYSVATGVLLGSAVTVLNFLILAISTSRALDKVMARRPEGEMDEDEAAEFAAKNQNEIQNAVKISYLVRTFTMLATLVVAFLMKEHFNVIATVIPLIMFRPIISISELFKRRKGK